MQTGLVNNSDVAMQAAELSIQSKAMQAVYHPRDKAMQAVGMLTQG